MVRSADRVLRVVRRLVDGLLAHNAFQAAGSIAFWFFLSLIPLLVFLGWLLGQVVRSKGVDTLVAPLLELAPPSTEGVLRKELERMAGASTLSIGPLSIGGLLWTASSGFHNLMDVFEIAVHARRRVWWKKRLIAIVWVLAGLGIACGFAWSVVTVDAKWHAKPAPTATAAAAKHSKPTAPHATSVKPSSGKSAPSALPSAVPSRVRHRIDKVLHGPGEHVLAVLSLLAVGTSALACFYRFAVRHAAGVRRRAWPGAITAVICWMLVSWVFGKYVASLAEYTIYYGSVAAVAVLLVWLYLTSLSLVIGAEVNAQLEGLRDEPLSRRG